MKVKNKIYSCEGKVRMRKNDWENQNMFKVYGTMKEILCSRRSFFLIAVFGMLLSSLFTVMSLYRIFLGEENAGGQKVVWLLYLSFLVLLLVIFYTLVLEWLKDCADEFFVLILCGQTEKELYATFRRMFFFCYFLVYVLSGIGLYLCIRPQGIYIFYSAGVGFIILSFLQIFFQHLVIRHYFLSFDSKHV